MSETIDHAAKAKADSDHAAKAKADAAAKAKDKDVDDDDSSPPPLGSETVPGGRYIRGATLRGAKLYGGHVGDCDGNVLATFKPNEINTGIPEDGHKPTKDDE